MLQAVSVFVNFNFSCHLNGTRIYNFFMRENFRKLFGSILISKAKKMNET